MIEKCSDELVKRIGSANGEPIEIKALVFAATLLKCNCFCPHYFVVLYSLFYSLFVALYFSYTSAYTMDVIAQTAFGLELDIQSSTKNTFVAHAGTFMGISRKTTIWAKFKQSITFAVFCMHSPSLFECQPVLYFCI